LDFVKVNMLNKCECGGTKMPSGYCKTINPCVHSWTCDSCGKKGECSNIGSHDNPAHWFETWGEALDEQMKRLIESRKNGR
jgi:hypothetical protein